MVDASVSSDIGSVAGPRLVLTLIARRLVLGLRRRGGRFLWLNLAGIDGGARLASSLANWRRVSLLILQEMALNAFSTAEAYITRHRSHLPHSGRHIVFLRRFAHFLLIQQSGAILIVIGRLVRVRTRYGMLHLKSTVDGWLLFNEQGAVAEGALLHVRRPDLVRRRQFVPKLKVSALLNASDGLVARHIFTRRERHLVVLVHGAAHSRARLTLRLLFNEVELALRGRVRGQLLIHDTRQVG